MKKHKVYFDDSCYVCSIEISALRKRGEACGIEFVDIANGQFPDEYMNEMVGEFDGEKPVGIETFRQMYSTLGFKKLVYFSRLPLIRTVVNAGYKVFAYGIRPYLPKRKK